MKFFGKKSSRPGSSGKKTSGGNSSHNFYSRHADEAPLDDYFDEGKVSSTHRTSRHSPARRRESSNRASRWAIAALLLRTVLVVLLLVGGFIVLRLVLERMNEPSEKEQQQWEINAARMEKTEGEVGFGASPVPQELMVNASLIKQRIEAWAQGAQLFRSAEALSRRGINEDAAQRLEQALRITPDRRAVQYLLADVYMNLGRSAEAVPLYIRLLDQEGLQPELQMNLLKALQESGQVEAGLVLADQMLLDQPNNEFVLAVVAAGQAQQGHTDAALTMYQRMLENSATNRVALKRCGEIYAERGDYERAISYYMELVRLDPMPEYYQTLAQCYARQNQAGSTVISLGQAASLFGSATVAPWLKNTEFDSVRETVEFRSLADRIVGAETRKAIEAINKRAAEKAATLPGEMELPTQPALQHKSNK